MRWQKMALLVLRRVGLCVGQNQMCHLCCWLKLFLKDVRWKKIKIQKRWLLGRLSDGSFVPLLYVYFCRSFLLCRLLGSQVTVFGFARERITCTNTQSKRQSSNLAKLLIRSTSPVLLQNRCYSQWFLSDASANHCQYYSFPPLSCRLVWLRIFYFQKGRKFFLFNFVSVGKVKALLQALV